MSNATRRRTKRVHPATRARKGVTGASVLLSAGLVAGMINAEITNPPQAAASPTPTDPPTTTTQPQSSQRFLLMLPDGRVVEVDPAPSSPSLNQPQTSRSQASQPPTSTVRPAMPLTRSHGSR